MKSEGIFELPEKEMHDLAAMHPITA